MSGLSPKMAGVKRKESIASTQQEGNVKKKVKKDDKPAKKSVEASYMRETETDSEPIVESDTASQSGEDDSVSWPSDANKEAEGWGEVEEHNNAGSVKVTAEAADGASEPKTSMGNSTGKQDPVAENLNSDRLK